MNAIKKNPEKSKNNGESEALLSLIIVDVLKTRETRHLMGELIPEIMRRWAGESSFKQRITSPVEGLIKRKLMRPSNGEGQVTLTALFDDPQFADILRRIFPDIINGVVQAINAMVKNSKSFSPEEREAFVTQMVTGLSQSSVGESFTLLFQTINEIHKDNPLYLSETLEPGVTRLIESFDVGELRDFVDNSREDMAALLKIVLGIFWKYPSKLVLLLTFTTDIVNILSTSVSEFLSVLNRISPDLLADVVLSIFRGINGRSIGKMIHEGAEIIRKFHAGNALIGEPGATQLPTDLSRFINDMLGSIDENILYKAKVALSEEKEMVTDVLRKVVKDNPDRLDKRLFGYSRERNSKLHEMNHMLSALESLPEESVADAVLKAAMNFETEEAAEIVNLFTALINRIRTLKPSIAREVVSRFVNTLDFSEIREGISGLSEEISEEIMPLGRAIIPKLVTGICKALDPADDAFEEDAAEARQLLRILLKGEEKVS